MAVIPTGDIFKTLTLDGVSSKDYSVYITGEAVFNSPARDVEMITIPGRNGSFALDKGRFENIEVTYPAGIAADTEAEFREAISDFRNFLASRNGYVRLEDDYNPNEYRLAVYKSGLDVTPAQLRAGEFDITFDCKPQRYLKSGEDAIAVDSGDVVSNPTLFASSPMLEVEGYGTINLNGSEIEIVNATMGDIEVARYADASIPISSTSWRSRSVSVPKAAYYNAGDTLTIKGVKTFESISLMASVGSFSENSISYAITGNSGASANVSMAQPSKRVYTPITFPDIDMVAGTASTVTCQFVMTVDHLSAVVPPVVTNVTFTIEIKLEYDPSGAEYDVFTLSGKAYRSPTANTAIANAQLETGSINASSSISILGDPTYVDCDLGEAYKEVDGSIVSLNRYIDLGSDLPKLAPGANTVTFDNTITDLQIVPRWWKI